MQASTYIQPDKSTEENAIVRMFSWWNDAFIDPKGFTPINFSEHYTDKAVLIVNGRLRGKGLEELACHYCTLQANFTLIQMELPVLDSFSCHDRAFVQCVTKANRGDEWLHEEAMAVATLENGKIALLKVIGRPIDQ